MAAPRILALLPLAFLLGACDGGSRPVAPPAPPGDPAAVEAAGGSGQSGVVAAELPKPLVVRVTDANGTPVPGARVLWSADSAAGRVDDSATITEADGTARTRWTLGTRAGPQQAGARIVPPGGGSSASAVFEASARAGAPAILFTGPYRAISGTLGVPLPMYARVMDQHRNGVPGVPVTYTVLSGGGTFHPSVVLTDSTGQARSDWVLGFRLGEIQTAMVEGANRGTLFWATPTLPSTATFTRVSGDAQTAAAGTVLPEPLVLEIRLADGRPVPGAPVEWKSTMEGDSITPRYSKTDDSGRVSVRWTLGSQPGARAALATVDRRSAASATFTATAAEGGSAPR